MKRKRVNEENTSNKRRKIKERHPKNNGTRRSIGMGYIKDTAQRKCLYNKRLNGSIKKNVELVEISRAPTFNFHVNPDTKYMSLLTMETTKLQSLFFLLGHILYLLDMKNKTELKTTWENQLKTLKDNIMEKKDATHFLKWLTYFNTISTFDIENKTNNVEQVLKNLQNFNY